MNCLIIFIFLGAVISLCCGLPTGAPDTVCDSMTPVHRGGEIRPQRRPSPYIVNAVKSGNKVRVTISSHVGEDFTGFFLQARSSKNKNEIVDGKFSAKTGVSKTVDCSNGRENSLTHTNTNDKREISTEWTPEKGTHEVIFRATVAKSYSTFWIEIDSSAVSVHGSSSSAGHSPQRSDLQNMYSGCSETKGCFGLPGRCIQSMDCDVLLSYGDATNGVSFTLHGALNNGEYMAMGLSTDQQMGDDAVTECIRQDMDIVVRESWNDRRSNERNNELSRNNYVGAFVNGLTTCTWTSKYNKAAVNGRPFNLQNANYYVLLAKGPMRNDGRLSYHSGKISTSEPVNFTSFELIDAESVHDAIKIHGTFMITAWVGLVSIGILLARHFKTAWENTVICGVQVWFAFHRGLMASALLFVIIAFIVIFAHKNGWNYETKNPHSILGCIATALGVCQPIMAAFRPDRNDSKRPLFNWLHWGIGNAAQIIAVVTIFFAVSLESSGLKESFYWVMAIFVIIHLIFHVLFQLHTMAAGKKDNSSKIMEMTASGIPSVNQSAISQPYNQLGGNVFRILLLGIYIIFLMVIILALWYLVGVA